MRVTVKVADFHAWDQVFQGIFCEIVNISQKASTYMTIMDEYTDKRKTLLWTPPVTQHSNLPARLANTLTLLAGRPKPLFWQKFYR